MYQTKRAISLAGGLVGVLVILSGTPASAGSDVDSTTSPLTDAEIDKRIDFIESRLDDSRLHGQIWYWSWMGINGGSAVVLGTFAGLANHEDDAVNNGVQAGVAAIGVADLLFRPLEARYGADPIRSLPDATREEKLAKLHAAEDQLQRNAERADERTSLAMHAANVGLNAAAGGIIALVGKPSDGLIAGISGTAGGVINILTEPWEPARDWKDYQAMVAGEKGARSEVNLSVVALRGGGELAVRWQW